MTFEFQCPTCGEVIKTQGPIGKVPRYPTHCGQLTQRLYAPLQSMVQWGWADYANLAYDGTESVPGLSHQEVRETIDNWS